MSRPLRFVNTNVLVYAFDPTDSRKQSIARELLQENDLVFAPQVFFESTDVLVRRFGVSPAEAVLILTPFLQHRVTTITEETVREAWRIMARYQLRIFDAALVAAALSSGCRHFLTEDLRSGQNIEGLEIFNPFAG